MQRSQIKLPEGELVWQSFLKQEQCQLCLYAAPGIATPDGCSCCGAGANVTNDGTAQNSNSDCSSVVCFSQMWRISNKYNQKIQKLKILSLFSLVLL